MGGDGGALSNKRRDVEDKRKSINREGATKVTISDHDQEVLRQRSAWVHCALSKSLLWPPIVADRLGNMYNKSSVIEYLLAKNEAKKAGVVGDNNNDDDQKATQQQKFSHLKKFKDVKELLFESGPISAKHLHPRPKGKTPKMMGKVENAGEGKDAEADNYKPTSEADVQDLFRCPMTDQIGSRGITHFCYFLECGHVCSVQGVELWRNVAQHLQQQPIHLNNKENENDDDDEKNVEKKNEEKSEEASKQNAQCCCPWDGCTVGQTMIPLVPSLEELEGLRAQLQSHHQHRDEKRKRKRNEMEDE